MTGLAPTRCHWAQTDPLLAAYHDAEWGVPERDGRALWEKLMLDGFQAGLAWITILRKRDAFRAAFANFDPVAGARFTEDDVVRLLGDAGIVRSRAKIQATIGNARAFLAMQAAGEEFSSFVWSFVGGDTIVSDGQTARAKSPESEALSAALKARGFKFVGPVIVYAWMQACGLVDDHEAQCFRYNAA
ncbi:DNA-3-methyladenine glycosylase I [Sphingomonas ginsenosidivorax]|uniref:DNA-3-methyladenine glycosylase I n=1 Tax=Sphingomonas ginsenosidivorax TaxID=862135 RepID=A0A5C6UEK3_9SPHN|nr:DNA-3-methyladenine glycosylase I [Sphingomonas ginsenosidivorax]TXC70465.1 DNA-3-methyladenine glycosylase I [Sphingomonas ginsenosidivorax]